MTIRSQYYDLMKDMPSSFNFLILHYSPNRFVIEKYIRMIISFLMIFSEILYAALFNSKVSRGTPVGITKQASVKSSGLIIFLLNRKEDVI